MPCLLRAADECGCVVWTLYIFRGLTEELLVVESVGKVFRRFQIPSSFSLSNSRVLGTFQTSGCVDETPTVHWVFPGNKSTHMLSTAPAKWPADCSLLLLIGGGY